MTQTETHDPTSSATRYPAHPAALTNLSYNEVETLCLKAARGAGMAWGLAEEAGFAAAWLAAHGIDGAGALLACLQSPASRALTVRDRHWSSAEGDTLCPIMLGAALDDHARLDVGPWAAPITIGAVSQPVLLVPFLARAAQASARPLMLDWVGGSAVVLADGTMAEIGLLALSCLKTSTFALSAATLAAARTTPTPAMGGLCTATLSALNTLALRTTVPASEASRRGAGAAASDND